MSEEIEVKISGTKSRPKVVDIDAKVVARIIIRSAHASEKPAIKAANEIMDYLTECMRGASTMYRGD